MATPIATVSELVSVVLAVVTLGAAVLSTLFAINLHRIDAQAKREAQRVARREIRAITERQLPAYARYLTVVNTTEDADELESELNRIQRQFPDVRLPDARLVLAQKELWPMVRYPSDNLGYAWPRSSGSWRQRAGHALSNLEEHDDASPAPGALEWRWWRAVAFALLMDCENAMGILERIPLEVRPRWAWVYLDLFWDMFVDGSQAAMSAERLARIWAMNLLDSTAVSDVVRQRFSGGAGSADPFRVPYLLGYDVANHHAARICVWPTSDDAQNWRVSWWSPADDSRDLLMLTVRTWPDDSTQSSCQDVATWLQNSFRLLVPAPSALVDRWGDEQFRWEQQMLLATRRFFDDFGMH